MLVGVLAALLVSIASPATGLVVLAFMAPLKPPPAIPAPGFNLVLISAILLGCVYRLPIERPRLRAAPALLLLAAFVLYAFVQQLPELLSGYADPRAHDVGYLFYQLLAGFGTIVAAGLVLRNRSPYPVLVALLLSAVFAVALAIVTADGGGSLEGLVAKSDLASRSSGPFGNPNNFGQFLAYACTLALAWFVTAGSSRVRLSLVLAVGVIGYGLSLSLSRGAVATLLAGLVALAFTRGRALGLTAVAAALVLVIVGYPLLVEWRLTNETGSASAAAAAGLAASDTGRFGAVLAAPALLAISPVFGIGFGQYKFMSALVTDAGGGLSRTTGTARSSRNRVSWVWRCGCLCSPVWGCGFSRSQRDHVPSAARCLVRRRSGACSSLPRPRSRPRLFRRSSSPPRSLRTGPQVRGPRMRASKQARAKLTSLASGFFVRRTGEGFGGPFASIASEARGTERAVTPGWRRQTGESAAARRVPCAVPPSGWGRTPDAAHGGRAAKGGF